MRFAAGRIGKFSLILLLVLLASIFLYVVTLAYPSPLFAYEASFGGYRIYSDEPIPTDMARVIEDTARRVEAMEHIPSRSSHRVYLCNSPERYAFFAFLTRKSAESLAIGLNVANETFVSMSRVREFAAKNQGALRHTRFEGNLAEVIAHEIAHFHSVRALGYRVHLAQPPWKSEGWAEYQANIAAIRADSTYDLRGRIEMLFDGGYWSGSGFARDLWEWQLLVEFLGEVKGYRLADLVRADVTMSSVQEQMMNWYRSVPESATGAGASLSPTRTLAAIEAGMIIGTSGL